MKIFYTASIDNFSKPNEHILKFAKETLPELIKAHTNSRLVTHFVDGVASDEQTVSAILADIRSADAFISEMSIPSQTLGFELAYANLHFVPSLYLYHSDIQGMPESLIANNPTRKLWVKEYSEDNLEGAIRNFIRKVERQMETARTSFMSTREIDDFISRESDSRGISKGEIIRQALSEAAKNKNYSS